MYISDLSNCRIRKVTVSTGVISTFAGNGGTGDYSSSGDDGPATSASIGFCYGIAIDASGIN